MKMFLRNFSASQGFNLFRSRLEASCLQLGVFAYVVFRNFLLRVGALFRLQWESATAKHLKLNCKHLKLNCKQKAPTASTKAFHLELVTKFSPYSALRTHTHRPTDKHTVGAKSIGTISAMLSVCDHYEINS